MCVDQEDNELEILEIIHYYVEILDHYFGSVSWPTSFNNNWFRFKSTKFDELYYSMAMQVCELDLIFNFHKVYYKIITLEV